MEIDSCDNDFSIGPSVHGCRDDFDFTLKFEKIFLSILPASCFISISLLRILMLVHKPEVVSGSLFKATKLVLIIFYASLHLVLLVFSSMSPAVMAGIFITSSALDYAAALCMVPLSFLEHSRSRRPSVLLGPYLSLTVLCDAVQARTMWLAATSLTNLTLARIFTVSVAVKLVIIALEVHQKTRWLVNDDENNRSPEETSGLCSLGAYLWLNKLFLAGYNKVLAMKDLFPLESDMAAERLHTKLLENINGILPGQKMGLARALAKTLSVPLFIPVGPRIALIGFTFCQPFLIESILDYLQKREEKPRGFGYGLIGATVLLYAGIAVATSLYWYFHERTLYMARGCLSTAVYKKTTESKLSAVGESAAVTLMSTDVERILKGFLNLHEFWADTVEVAIASWLLQRKIGTAFLAPICLAIVCIICTAVLSKFTGHRQRAWMEQIQKRVGLTANIISSMKHLKISGLTAPIEESIQQMRLNELRVGGKFRMLQIVAIITAFVPLLFSPVMTFAVTSRTLDVVTIYTSISYLYLLTNPLSLIFRFVPNFLGACACLNRIQAFLEEEPRTDFREFRPANGPFRPVSAMKIVNGNFGWEEGKHSLKDINLTIPRAGLTIIVGPVASGKSTLCKALLGETPVSQGQVILGCNARSIGYCDQTPFLSNTTIRENIIGFSNYNPTRYSEVIEASMLSADLSLLPQGDETRVGSNGITLSGGQRQRVSMARALYLESDAFIFDDILSGLDADTEEQVFRRVFSPGGILKKRGATAILCTHSVRHIPAADYLVALSSDGNQVEEGTFEDLVANKKYIYSLGVRATDEKSTGSRALNIEADAPSQWTTAPTVEYAERGSVENLARKAGDATVYKHYFKSIGILPLIAFCSCCLGYGFFYNFPTIWMKFWSEDTTSANPTHHKAFYVGLYAVFEVSALVFFFLVVLLGLKYLIQLSGAALHRSALQTVVRAPLHFFSTTDSGVVTNLFSQDMSLIDGELPMAMINVSVDTAVALGMASIVATSSPYLVIGYPVIFAVFYVIQKIYLRTSRQMRLLDLEAKSPLYTHFLDTIKGIATIRALGWTDRSIFYNHQLVDISQRPAYLLAMIQRWLGFTLNSIVLIMAVLIVVLSTQLRSNASFTGAGLFVLMQFGKIMTQIINYYTQLETSIGAVSRLKSFSEATKSEILPGEDMVPIESWPSKGRIEVKGVSASYGVETIEESDESDHMALRGLDLTIEPGQKVAICGRTGSGKSSVILLLLRLLDPIPSCSQEIIIDDIPLQKIERSALRRRIIAVPQDAIFMPDGTSFKANLDPFAASTEAECQSVLEDVDLWALVHARGGLHAGMSPDTLSQGQKQLFSLARAILRRRVKSMQFISEEETSLLAEKGVELREQGGGILLLDEVSSSVDMETDRTMQNLISREFNGYTIIMVAHRLDMVIDFDLVLVMDSGSVVEAGNPKDLVSRERGRFRDLWLVGNRG